MTGLHRFDTAILTASQLDISGRTSIVGMGEKTCSLSHIGSLALMDSSTIMIQNPVEDIGEYYSLNRDGLPTTSASPFNKIVFTSGSTLFIRALDPSNDYNPVYGEVTGYTILSVSDNAPYGGYVLGSDTSTGGFMILNKGTYSIADRSDFDGGVKCWFISGVENKVATISLLDVGSTMASTSVDLMKLQKTSYIRYTGGTFITSMDGITFNDPSDLSGIPSDREFAFTLGMTSGTKSSVLASYDAERGVVDPVVFSETSTETFELTTGSVSGSTFTPVADQDGVFTMNMEFYGVPDGITNHLGYLLLYLQEVNVVEYTTSDGITTEDVMISSRIELRVDLFTTGDTVSGEYNYNLNTVGGVGDVDLIFPSGLNNYTVNLLSISSNKGGDASDLTIKSTLNKGNTTGWVGFGSTIVDNEYNTKDCDPLSSPLRTIGTLSGGFMATLRFSVSDPGSEGTVYCVQLVLKNSAGVLYPSNESPLVVDVNITVIEKDKVKVTFYDYQHGMSEITRGTVIEYNYGVTITEADCAPVYENFLGWYTDPEFHNIFNFSTPLTKDMSLYARYTYVVTFDYQDGTTSQLYVASELSGVQISPPAEPSRTGYLFGGWYKQSKCLEAWNFSTDTVEGNITLYARWVGVELRVLFTADDDLIVYE
jgi:uncharacterized repeat protein (TIGR02543 family)